MEDIRKQLRPNSEIFLKNNKDSAVYKFRIERFLGSGGSAVCYKARMDDKNGVSVPGTLKEFYPVDPSLSRAYWLDRISSGDEKEHNQLRCKGSVPTEYFIEARDLFRNTYLRLEQTRANFKDLFAPIANFYLYSGIGDDVNFTYYVWIPYDVEIDTFKQYLETVCEDMDNGFGKTMHLKMILESIKNLACAIKAVHTAGLRHLDITPSNFGLQRMNDGVTSAISLIDVNTMYSNRDDNVLRSLGTPGFRRPELKKKSLITVDFDIFSIGACLFYALVMEKDDDKYVNKHFAHIDDFKALNVKQSESGTKISRGSEEDAEDLECTDEYLNFCRQRWESIADSLSRSPIFRGCDATEDRILQNSIIRILQKCLTLKKEDTYEGVTILIEDLEETISYLGLIDGMETVKRNNSDVVLMKFCNKEEVVAEDSKLGANGAIWNFLYDMPLYRYAKNGKLNILVMGFGVYASKFIDIAFQLAQTDDYETEITVVSNEIEDDKNRFLAARPEYPNFFEIDGTKAANVPDNPYGKIRFMSASFSKKIAENEIQLKKILKKTELDYGFCFAAMHSDELNFSAASAAVNVFRKTDFMAGFAVFGETDSKGRPQFVVPEKIRVYANRKRLFPVDINMTVDKNPDYKLLRQMAFNVHLVWMDGLEDIEYSKAKFRKPYNWESSFANAVSIKYKLHSMGIRFDPANLRKTAAEYLSVMDSNPDLLDVLVMYEHRRWNIETMAKGWVSMPTEQYGELKDATKDEKGKRHPCLVPSFISDKPEASLSHISWEKDNRQKWNSHTESDIELLDPLDRVSVLLHKSFMEKKNENDRSRLYKLIDEISSYLSGEPSLRKIFSSFVLSVNALLESRKTAGTYESTKALINSYKYYLRVFRKHLKAFSEKLDTDKIEKLIKEANGAVFPMLEAQAYTNFKKKDEALITNIPFILTYTPNMRFLIPLVTENVNEYSTTELFNNVAAAIMTSPKYITYAVELNVLQMNFDGVVCALNYIRNTLINHSIPSKISVLILAEDTMRESAYVSLNALMDKIPGLYSADILSYPGSDVHKSLEEYLKVCSRSNSPFTAIQNNDSKISGYLTGCRLSPREQFPCFTFNSENQSFECVGKCEYLRYIPFRPSLRTEDMFLSKGKISDYEEPEFQKFYKDLWYLYKSNPGNSEKEAYDAKKWKTFCRYMKKFDEQKQDSLVFEEGEFEDYNKVIPVVFRASFEKLLAFFKNEKMADSYSFVYINSSMVEVRSRLLNSVKLYFEKLLTDCMEDLVSADNFKPEKRGTRIYIPHGNLFFKGVKLPADVAEKDAFIQILNRLSALGLISGYKSPKDASATVSFICVSPEVKKLITVEGYLFEIYCYYSLIETGFFDEVRTSLKVMWNELNLASEFDIVAVKNFRTVLIECKTTDEIEQEFYNKLFALKNIFGINSKALLVADMCSRHEESVSFQSTRGDAYGIKTISATKEITFKKNDKSEFPGLGYTIINRLK